ncbi:MAG: hypothetical protein GY808_14405 [Gammaproteobacteria bacterium]|nr:hypothetical protein [Gammaproteobacteria bacterium]
MADIFKKSDPLPENVVQAIAIFENVGGKVPQSAIELMLKVEAGEITTEQATEIGNAALFEEAKKKQGN